MHKMSTLRYLIFSCWGRCQHIQIFLGLLKRKGRTLEWCGFKHPSSMLVKLARMIFIINCSYIPLFPQSGLFEVKGPCLIHLLFPGLETVPDWHFNKCLLDELFNSKLISVWMFSSISTMVSCSERAFN